MKRTKKRAAKRSRKNPNLATGPGRWKKTAGPSTGERIERAIKAAQRSGKLPTAESIFKKKKNPKKRRRNSEDAGAADAQKLYRDFHQKKATGHRDVKIPVAVPVHLAQLGQLRELHVDAPKGHFILAPRGVTLTSTPDGKQMYFVGGDQVPPLSKLGVDGSKVHVCLGTLKKIVYLTRKGFHNFEPVEYVHRMGEEGGVPPELNYDTQSKLLYLVGGTYRVKPAGITN